MKITRTLTSNSILLRDLPVGKCFLPKDREEDKVLIKVKATNNEENTLSLNNNYFLTLSLLTEIYPVEIDEIIIRY